MHWLSGCVGRVLVLLATTSNNEQPELLLRHVENTPISLAARTSMCGGGDGDGGGGGSLRAVIIKIRRI